MVVGLRVSDRDLRLMLDLYENTFLSFYQIREEHFKDRAKPTVYNRLSKLINAKLIKSLRVYLVAHHRSNQDLGVIYQITKKGLSTLKSYFPEKSFRKDPVSISFYTLYHDLLLTDLLKKMRKDFSGFKFTNTKLLGSDPRESMKLPDAVMECKKTKELIAIELELTAKSLRRYQDIVFGYRTNNRYKKVFYVVGSEQIRRKIGGVITGYGSNYSPSDDTIQFYFAKSQFITDPFRSLELSNGAEIFRENNNAPQTFKEVNL